MSSGATLSYHGASRRGQLIGCFTLALTAIPAVSRGARTNPGGIIALEIAARVWYANFLQHTKLQALSNFGYAVNISCGSKEGLL